MESGAWIVMHLDDCVDTCFGGMVVMHFDGVVFGVRVIVRG